LTDQNKTDVHCASCGSKVAEGDRFCVSCGSVITLPNGSSAPVDVKPATPAATAQLAPPHLTPPAVSSTTSGLEIAATITAIFAPIVGLILGIVAIRSTAAKRGRPSTLSKIATGIAASLTATGIVATVVVSVGISQAATAARNAPFCAAVASNSNVLGPAGVQSLYKPMYNGDFTSLQDRIQKTEIYWNDNQSQISAWYDQWMALSALAPNDESLRKSLDDEAIILNPSTGFNGPDNPTVSGKQWYLVGLGAEDVNNWAAKNCG
jgi:hypothetical protein